jgi:predicted small secreted protein
MKPFYFTAVFVMAVSALLIAGCTTNTGAGKPLSDLTFSHMRPMPLQVSQVIKRDAVGQKRTSFPKDFMVPVDSMLDSYVDSRLRAMGGQDVLTVELEEMIVTHEQKDSESRVAGFMNVAKIDSYNLRMQFNLMVENPQTGAMRGKRFVVNRTINISEHSSVVERERRQQEGVKEMFRDIDLSMMEILKNEFRL